MYGVTLTTHGHGGHTTKRYHDEKQGTSEHKALETDAVTRYIAV